MTSQHYTSGCTDSPVPGARAAEPLTARRVTKAGCSNETRKVVSQNLQAPDSKQSVLWPRPGPLPAMSRPVLGPKHTRTPITWTVETLPGVKQLGREDHQPPPCSAGVTNTRKWNPTCIYAYAFGVYILRSLRSHV